MNESRLLSVLPPTLFALLTTPSLVGAQDETATNDQALVRLQQQPQITVVVSQRSRSVTAAFDVRVQLTNLTDRDFYLDRIQIVLPGDLVGARELAADSLVESVGQLLNPGQRRTISFYLPGTDLSLRSLWNYRLLTFSPGNHQAYVVVSYRLPPDETTDSLEHFELELEASLFSLIAGGIVGALLLAVFRAIGRWRKEEAFGWRLGLKDAVSLWVAGGVTSTIVILIIQRIEDFPLPVNLQVNDFYGGFVIGILSYHLSVYLSAWLFKDQNLLREYKGQ